MRCRERLKFYVEFLDVYQNSSGNKYENCSEIFRQVKLTETYKSALGPFKVSESEYKFGSDFG